jgi:hypothetical protein
MRPRVVGVSLAVATALVVIENVAYLRSCSPQTGLPAKDEADPPPEADEARARGALAAVCDETLRAYLAALPSLDHARSSFLTRAEAEAFASIEPSPEDARRLVLAGTLVSANRRVAWIDGIATSEGDLVGGLELIRIEPRSVVLRNGADELRIELREPAGSAALPAEVDPLPSREDAIP